ncbi:lamin tail domain-containing protein, partial [candidate division WOR-3 bacterium]|nr:lamin tail domain-containing protein [candidate division WOR-3 bacterium]
MKKVSAAFLALILVAFTLSAADIGAEKVEGPLKMELNSTPKLEPDRATWQSGVWSGYGWYIWDYAYYNFCKSQVIYHSDWMMDFPCDISKIGFYSFANSPTRHLKIFLGTTVETSFDGSGYLTNPPLVFEGDVSWLDGGVTEIALDPPFSYDGASNLLLVIEDWTGTYVSTHYIVGDNSSSSVNVTAFGYSDDFNPDELIPDVIGYGGYYIEFPLTYWTYLLAGHDVGVTSILAPTGMYSIGETVTPVAIVENFRASMESFSVTFNIYDWVTKALIYTDTESVDTLDPGEIRTVNFSPDIGTSQGAFTTEVFTALIGDEDPSNDTLWGSYYASMCAPATIFFEDFEDGIPCDWTIVDGYGDGVTWSVDNPGGQDEEGGCSGLFPICDSDYWSSTLFDEELITPSIDCSGYGSVLLSFSSSYENYAGYDWAYVDVSNDGGATWTNVIAWNEDHGDEPVENLDISAEAAGYSDVKIRFNYDTEGETWLWYWMIDNVTLEGEPQCPVITEIMNNPRKVSDTNGEWFEIYNPSTAPIDINGWVIRDADYDYHVIDVGDDTVKQELIIPAGGYVVLGCNADFDTNGGYTCDYQYSDFYLSNTGDEIILEYNGVIIDSVYYHQDDRDWYDPNGASAELWDPGLDNMDLTNWDLAYQVYGDGDHGTPGAENHTAVDPHEPNDNLFEATEVDSGTNFEDCYIHKDLPGGKWYGDLD